MNNKTTLIGISGRMGSGKDTVGEIIQKLCATNNGPVFEQKAFAGKLKQIASLLTGISVEKFEDQEFKKNLLDTEWGTVQDVPLNSIPPFADIQFNVMITVREFLQKLGTEAMRDNLHENVWVNALFSDYVPKRETLGGDGVWIENDKDYVHFGERFTYPSWCITDMRFPNEMEAVVKRGGITIRVVRPTVYAAPKDNSEYNNQELAMFNHPSETSLDSATFDFVINNDGTIEELVKKVKDILIHAKLL